MKILVISDLHIDTHDSFGIFQWEEKDFIAKLERVKKKYEIDRIILNGDTYDLYKYDILEIKKKNQHLMEYFNNGDFVFIKGNHDMLDTHSLDYFQITNSSGQTIHIEHGHNADWLNGNRLGRALCKLGFYFLKGIIHFKFLLNLYFTIIHKSDQIYHVSKKYNTIKYLLYALRLLKDHDVVIFGHTHKLESHHTYYINKKKRYINTGTCSMGRFQGVVMDTETLKYELIKESKESNKKK
jgi:predicted phosphodiesterase